MFLLVDTLLAKTKWAFSSPGKSGHAGFTREQNPQALPL